MKTERAEKDAGKEGSGKAGHQEQDGDIKVGPSLFFVIDRFSTKNHHRGKLVATRRN